MAHRPTGSTQTDRIRLPYTAPEASRRAFFVKELYRGTAWKGGHAAPDPGSVQVKIQDGNNQLCFQPTAQIFVHLGTGIAVRAIARPCRQRGDVLVHEWSGLAGFGDLSEKIFCRSYLAPYVSFGLIGRNETGRGAAAHAQALKETGFARYEPQYIKSEPQLTFMSVARCCVIGIFFVVAWASAVQTVNPALF